MKKITFFLILAFIGISLFGQPSDTQIMQSANALGVPYEALKQFVEIYYPKISTSDVISIESLQLAKEYRENEIRAESVYKGKMLKISGTIVDFGSSSGKYYVFFADSRGIYLIRAYFRASEINKLVNLSKGQRITILGLCKGKSGYLEIEDTIILN